MRFFNLLLLSLFLSSTIFGQTYTDKKGKQHLWGSTTLKAFEQMPYSEWYEKSYNKYERPTEKIKPADLENVQIKVFIGTWCGDTKDLFPKFIHLMDELSVDEKNMEIIALHSEDNQYKQGPSAETMGMNIHRVPTFIFEQNGEEIGRIVERTVFDLETDVQAIVKGMPYESRYQAVEIMEKYFATADLDSLLNRNELRKLIKKTRREVSGAGELNTYAYVLKAQNRMQEAECVFLLNTYLFRYQPNVHDSYGEFLMGQDRIEEATKEYYEVIRLRKQDSNAVAMLQKLNEMKVEKEH